MINVSVDEVEKMVSYPYSKIWIDNNAEIIRRLQTEIAYLSKLQRRIIIEYYFENRKQTDIEIELGIPLDTVKWHLFESKKN
jgi:sigma-70, region 4